MSMFSARPDGGRETAYHPPVHRRIVVLAGLAALAALAWWSDRAPGRVAGSEAAVAAAPTPPGGPFKVLVEAAAGTDVRVVRDRQKVHDRQVEEGLSLEVDAFEWVTVRVDDGLGVSVSWRVGGGEWETEPETEGPWEMTVLKSGARIVVFLDREPPPQE